MIQADDDKTIAEDEAVATAEQGADAEEAGAEADAPQADAPNADEAGPEAAGAHVDEPADDGGEGDDGDGGDGDAEDDEDDGGEAIDALAKLSPRLVGRFCRRLPISTLVAELRRIDRSVYFRYFKGYRPQKITGQRIETALRKECFEKRNGLFAQLVIFNWDEAEWRLYGAMQKLVKQINEDVEAIESISDEEGDSILGELEQQFDRRDVCIAAIVNGLRVSDEYLQGRYGDLLG
jgi:hypothetical protein